MTTGVPVPSQAATALTIVFGLLAHQVFRKREQYNIFLHTGLLLVPPTFAVIATAHPRSTFAHAFVGAWFTYILTLIASVVIYRLSPLHPLAVHPGPTACKITKLWPGILSIPGYQHKYIHSLHDRYGNVIRIGPNELSIRDASLLNSLVGQSGVPKGPHFSGRLLTDTNLPMVAISDTETHLRRRRNWSRGMGQAALKDYEHIVSKRAHQLVNSLEAVKGKVMLDKWFQYFSYDFMCDMAYGGGSELMTSGEDKNAVWGVLEDAMRIGTFFGHIPWLGVYVGKIPAATGNLNILLKRCAEFTKARLEKGSEKKDLFHYLRNEDIPDKPPPPMQHLVDDGILAIVAGADTTASALTSIFHCLLSHPAVYSQLQAEVDKFYPHGEDALDSKHHRHMKYLNAVINEALRVFPPVPGGIQRQVPHDGSSFIAGNLHLPPGTIFWTHIYSHHHNPAYFSPRTSEFWPERWLLASAIAATSSDDDGQDERMTPSDTDPERTSGTDTHNVLEDIACPLVHNEAAFIPFSHGPMNCVGKTLAMMELRTVVCAIVQRFHVRPSEGWDAGRYEREWKDYFTATRPEVPAVLEVRAQ